jgi:hypothetical protein
MNALGEKDKEICEYGDRGGRNSGQEAELTGKTEVEYITKV